MKSSNSKWLPSTEVCARYGNISRRTLYRWRDDPDLGFPQPVTSVNNRDYYDEEELTQWERSRAAPRKAA